MRRDQHFYFGSSRDSFFFTLPYEYARWKDGKEYKTEAYEKGWAERCCNE